MNKDGYKRIIFQKLETFYPEVLEDCKPILPEMNKTKIKAVFDTFCDVRGIMPEEVKEEEITVFLAVSIRFFDPDYILYLEKPLRRNFRPLIAELLNKCPTGVSHLISPIRVYWKINGFRDEVLAIGETISNSTGIELHL